MKRLLLLRHAKAQPADDATADFDRVLLPGGREDGAALAQHLRRCGHGIDHILCSAAVRTSQTAELVRHEQPAGIAYQDALYLADAARIIAAVRAAPAHLSALMLVGHNPGMEDSAATLAREPVRRKERVRYEALEEKFPTCACAILDFDVARWRDVAEGTGRLVEFIRPRDLRTQR